MYFFLHLQLYGKCAFYFICYLIFPVLCVTDPPYVLKSSAVQSLNGDWVVENSNKSIAINSTVPGSIYTDLMNAKIIGDPYYRMNDVAYKWIGLNNWIFYKHVQVECEILQKKRVILVFHGLDTVAEIFVNNKSIGITNNMFVRYIFEVKSIMMTNNITNNITVAFQSSVKYAEAQHEKQLADYIIPPTCPPPIQKGDCHINYIRKIQSSFSWDWGPSFPGVGIWKDVEIVGFDTVLIRDILVTTEKINITNYKSSWKLHIIIHLDNAVTEEKSLNLEYYLNNQLLQSSTMAFNPQNNTAEITSDIDVPRAVNIKEWWPNGLGNQTLYTLKAVIAIEDEITTKEVRIGFRTLELIQEPINNGSDGFTFYFRVNGVPFFAKGSNWIPADSVPSRVTPEYTRHLLQSAKDAHMNMMRVWGGGSYETDVFYELADEFGIFIWQDIMFACALYPVNDEFLDSVSLELRQQVRRIQHHPSILLWAGNNENEEALVGQWWPVISERYDQYKSDYLKLYIETLMPIVKKEDPSRTFLSSSPSNGRETESEGWLSSDPSNPKYGDVHFYSYFADILNWTTYPLARFISEYGFQSHPSFETYAQVSEPSDWTFPNSGFLNHRQHHTLGEYQFEMMIEKYLIFPNRSCGEAGFKDFLYLTQIVQAMGIKTETEFYRRSMSNIDVYGLGKTMGALYWQLNDVWQGASWSSIEYGGKWKILHYYAQKFFSPLLCSPFIDYDKINVSVVSDSAFLRRNLVLRVYVYKWSSFTPAYTDTVLFNQPAFYAQQVYSRNIYGSNSLLDEASCSSVYECFIYTLVSEPTDLVEESSNFLLLSHFKDAKGLSSSNIRVVNITGPISMKESEFSYKILLSGTNIAPYVLLDIPGIKGRFSDNGFFMITKYRSLYFHSLYNVSSQILVEKIIVRSLMDTCR